MKNKIIFCLIIIISICLISCEPQNVYFHTTEDITSSITETTAYTVTETTEPVPSKIPQDDIVLSPEDDDNFSVTFYPVGKGDCIIARCGGETMMIDSGYKKNSDEIFEYLSANSIERLDIIIATHPDKDHIGAFADIIESGIEIGIIYKTDAVKGDAKTYESFISAIESNGITTENPTVGSKIKFGNAKITFLGPLIKYYKDINDSSIVIRIEYADKSFLFTGDMLASSESIMLNGEYAEYISSDILKISHHGNDDASLYDFLAEVNPSCAIITSDYKNGDPPAESVLENLENLGAEILRTDIEGLIKISVSASGKIEIFTDKGYIEGKENNNNDDTNS